MTARSFIPSRTASATQSPFIPARSGSRLQTKLKINAPGGVYEQEADRIANQVLATPARPSIAQAPLRIQRLSGQATGQMDSAPTSVDAALASPGRPLELTLRQDMEQRFGHDFSRVRVHSDAAAEQSTREVNANAYTVGQDIVFGADQFSPHRPAGRRLLSHELTHVVQQSNSSSILHMQRQPRGAAAGCGICMNDPGGRAAGDIAHAEVQGAFIAANPDVVAERPVPGIPNSGIDLSYERWRTGEHALLIGEIKPLDDAGQQAGIGRRQLQDYAREMMLSGQYDEVYRMGDAPPPGPLYFFNPMNPAGCPRQTIRVQLSELGLYQYYCEPPFSQLVRNPSCRCTRPEDEEPPSPPQPPIWVQPGDQPGSSETKGKGGDQPGKGNGVPEKGNGVPEKGDGSRKPGRPGRPQPRPGDKGIDWGRVLRNVGIAAAILAAIVVAIIALPAEILAGIVAGLVALLGFLGLAFAGGKKGSGSTGRGSGRTGSSTGRTGAPSGSQNIQPVPPKPSPTPARPQGVSPLGKGPATVQTPAKPPPTPGLASAHGTRISKIEGLNPESLSIGMLPIVWLFDEKKPDWKLFAVLQVTRKFVDPNSKATTVEFKSLWETSSEGTRSLHSGLSGSAYFITSPYASSHVPGLVGHTTSVPGNLGDAPLEARVHWLEILIAELESAGRKAEADQVRNEIQRYQSQLGQSKP
jgi:hypothetical protein